MTAFYKVDFIKEDGSTDYTIVETKEPDVEEILIRDPSQFYKFMNYLLKSAVTILNIELLYDGERFSNFSEKVRYLFMQIEQIGEIGTKLTDLKPDSKMTKKEVNEVVTLEWKLEELVEKLSMFTTCLSWLENGALREQQMPRKTTRNESVAQLKQRKAIVKNQIEREKWEKEMDRAGYAVVTIREKGLKPTI